MPALNRSLSDILQDSLSNFEDIVRLELQLAGTEVRSEIRKVKGAVAWLAAGAVSGLFTLLFLLLAAYQALAVVLPLWAAALTVGASLGAATLFAIASGKRRFQALQLLPTRALKVLKENAEWVRQRTR